MKINYPKFRKDLTNQQFSHLSVIAFNDKTKKWKCQCECGNIIEVETKKLISGRIKSCGCMKYVRKYNKDGNSSRLLKIYREIIYYNRRKWNSTNNWEDFEDFKKWAKSNDYMEQLSYKKITTNEPYSKNNLIFGIKYKKKFLPIKDANNWNIYYNKEKGEFLIRFKYNKATVIQEHIVEINDLCSLHISMYKRYFHKKSFFE